MSNDQYYLHENGDMIYKPHGGVDVTSNFVKRLWESYEFRPSGSHFLNMLKEAHSLGARKDRLYEMAKSVKLEQFVSDWEDRVIKND